MDAAARQGHIVIAGGSGFLGRSLARHMAAAGFGVALLSRRPPKEQGPWEHVAWDARTVGPWGERLDGAAGLVNLVGRTVDCIKTPDHCDEILRSRVEATRALGEALRRVERPPPVWVQMSTAHIYGDPPEVVCDEDSAFGYGLAPTVARAWEAAFDRAYPPDSNAEFMRELRRAVGMPIGLPAPAWLVRLGAPLAMRTDPESALYGRYCLPRRWTDEGFEFRFATVREALADLFTAR